MNYNINVIANAMGGFDYNYETSTLTAPIKASREQMIDYLKFNWDDPFHTYEFIEFSDAFNRYIKIVSPDD